MSGELLLCPARPEPTGLVAQLDFVDWADTFTVVPNLLYIDPPFNSGRDFGDFDDKGVDYNRVAEVAKEVLSRDGNFLLHLDWRSAHLARTVGDRVFGRRAFQNEIVWKYNSGGASRRRLARKHDTILWYGLGGYVFNVEREPYPHDYGDRPGFHPDGKMLSDVWEVPRLSNTALERTGWATEKPPALLERIVRMFSDPGQVVADFMCGSGTTGVAALRLGRGFVLSDVSADAVALTRRRLGVL